MAMERSSLRFDEAKGPKLLPRFVVYVALAAGLMVADYRFSLMQPVRAAVMPMLYPVQWLANQPVQLYQYFADLSQSKSELLEQNRQLMEENGRLKIDLQRDKVNTDELRELKKLYGLQQKGIHNVIGAEVISNGKDPLSERLIIGKGSQDGLKVGDAVIDQNGLIGLLTQVHTQSAEIGLISGGQSIVPIAVSRTGERNLAYGNGNGLDLRYFPTGSDLEPGDVLLTSGLDGTYPAGIPVATVSKVVRASGTPYYDTQLTPLAALRSSRFDFDDSYRAVPLHIMAASLIVMMILDFMPFSFDGFFWLPEMTALMLLYWALHQPQRAGMGLAFAIGLIVDAATAATLGLHALSYVVMTYFILSRRQIILYGHIMQLAAVLAALLLNQAVLTVARLFLNHQVITLQGFVAPFVGALLWPILSQLMLIVTRIYRSR